MALAEGILFIEQLIGKVVEYEILHRLQFIDFDKKKTGCLNWETMDSDAK